MPTVLNADWRGLLTAPGALVAPTGSLLKAVNLGLDAPGVLRCRRGLTRQLASGVGIGRSIWQVVSRRGNTGVLANHGTGTTATSLSWGNGQSAWTAITGTVTNGTNLRMRAAEALGSLYLTSVEGLRRLETDDALAYAGMPPGMPPLRGRDFVNAFTALTGTGGFLADGSACAYRVTWHTYDAQGTELGGPPSGRTVFRNLTGSTGYGAGVARNVLIRVPLPPQWGTTATALVAGEWRCRVWRTRTSASALGPDDECYLVSDAVLTAGDVAAGYVTFTDVTTDAILTTGAKLHTNANDYLPDEALLATGLLNADAPPPRFFDVALWDGRLWGIGDCAERQFLPVVMLANPADGDTFTVLRNGVGTTYTFRNAPASATDVQIETGYASAQNDVEATTGNLVDAINLRLSYAWVEHVALGASLAGQFVLRARELSGVSLTSSVSVAANWQYGDPAGAGVAISSSPDNALRASKLGRPDAWPVVNEWEVGPASTASLRLTPLRDALLVWSQAGLYRVTGSSPQTYRVELIDSSLALAGNSCVAVVEDSAYAWCTTGIYRVDSGGGVECLSLPIRVTVDTLLTQRNSGSSSWFSETAFAVAMAQEKRVLFWYPKGNSSVTTRNCNEALVWNIEARGWTTWNASTAGFGVSCGVETVTASAGVGGQAFQLYLADSDPAATTGDGFLYRYEPPGTFLDTYRNGTTSAVRPEVALVAQVPDSHGAVNWLDVVIHWDRVQAALTGAEDTSTFNPSFATAAYEPPEGAQTVRFWSDIAAQGLTAPGTAPYVDTTVQALSLPSNYSPMTGRVLVPSAAKRARQLRLDVFRATATAEPWGIQGISLRYEGPGTTATRDG
jgi:hypothetical protein